MEDYGTDIFEQVVINSVKGSQEFMEYENEVRPTSTNGVGMYGKSKNQAEIGLILPSIPLPNQDGPDPRLKKPKIGSMGQGGRVTVGCQLSGLANGSCPGYEGSG